MKNQKLNAYVEKADDRVIRVMVIDQALIAPLREFGFSPQGVWLIKEVAGDLEKATAFDALRLMNIPFSDGKEWCPAEVFEYLRDTGLLSGDFIRVSWTQPGYYRLTISVNKT